MKQKLRSVALVRIPGGTLLFCAMHHCTVACASILNDGVSRSRFSGLHFIPCMALFVTGFGSVAVGSRELYIQSLAQLEEQVLPHVWVV